MNVIWHGLGEPLLDKGLTEKVKIAKDMGFRGRRIFSSYGSSALLDGSDKPRNTRNTRKVFLYIYKPRKAW